MSIINDPEPVNLSVVVNRQMRMQAKRLISQAESSYEQALQTFWKHPTLTPQEVSDSLGTDAASFFALYNNLRIFIQNSHPGASLTQVASLGTFTINPDGTVTINSVN